MKKRAPVASCKLRGGLKVNSSYDGDGMYLMPFDLFKAYLN